MNALEAEVTALANAPDDMRRTLTSFMKLVQLIHVLVDAATAADTAEQGIADHSTLLLLERAEMWCEYLDAFLPPEHVRQREMKLAGSDASLVAAAPVWVHAFHCKLRATGALRDAYRRGQQWSMCLSYAEKVDAINRAIAQEWSKQPPSVGDRRQREEALLAVGRSTLSVGALQSKLDRHNSALEKTRDAAQILEGLFRSMDRGEEDTTFHRLEPVSAVWVAALYSTASELEHLDRANEALAAYRESFRIATDVAGLPQNHPLLKKIRTALEDLRAPTASHVSTPRSSVGERQRRSRPVPLSERKPAALDAVGGDWPIPPRTADAPTHLLAELRNNPGPPPPSTARIHTAPAPPQRAKDSSALFHRSRVRQHGMAPDKRAYTVDALSVAPPADGATETAPRPSMTEFDGTLSLPAKTAVPHEERALGVSLKSSHGGGDRRLLFPPKPAEAGGGGAPRESQGGILLTSTIAHLDDTVLIPTTSDSDVITKSTGKQKKKTESCSSTSALHDRELELKRRYLVWAESAARPLQGSYIRRSKAALCIQCAWRSARARLEAYNRRQCLYHFVHHLQRRAAGIILARYRTHVTQRQCRLALEARARRRAAHAQEEQRRRDAVVVILRYMHALVRRRRLTAEHMRVLQLQNEAKLKLYDTAAVIVQRWWPIAKSTRAYWIQRNKQLAAQRLVEAEENRKHTAATNISRVFRGFRSRKETKQYKAAERERRRALQDSVRASIDVIRIFLREVRARRERLAVEADLQTKRRIRAAALIQTSWARSLQREHMKLVSKRGRLVRSSAAMIQRCYRKYRARRDLRVMRTISKTHVRIRLEREWAEERAALRIQCAWRQHMARRRVRQVKASYGRRLLLALWHIQRTGRGHATRVELGVHRALSIALSRHVAREAVRYRDRLLALIQSCARAVLSQRQTKVLQEAEAAEALLIARRARREMLEDRAATEIQRIFRGTQGRRHATLRREVIGHSSLMVQRAVVRIQCFVRQSFARAELHRQQSKAWQLRKKQMQWAEVQAALFSQRVEELGRLEAATRSAIITKECVRSLGLVSRAVRLGYPPSTIAAVAMPRSRGSSASLHDDAPRSSPADLVAEEERARGRILRDEVYLMTSLFASLQTQLPSPSFSVSATPEAMYDVALPPPPPPPVATRHAPEANPPAHDEAGSLPCLDGEDNDGSAPVSCADVTRKVKDAFDSYYDVPSSDDDDHHHPHDGMYD